MLHIRCLLQSTQIYLILVQKLTGLANHNGVVHLRGRLVENRRWWAPFIVDIQLGNIFAVGTRSALKASGVFLSREIAAISRVISLLFFLLYLLLNLTVYLIGSFLDLGDQANVVSYAVDKDIATVGLRLLAIMTDLFADRLRLHAANLKILLYLIVMLQGRWIYIEWLNFGYGIIIFIVCYYLALRKPVSTVNFKFSLIILNLWLSDDTTLFNGFDHFVSLTQLWRQYLMVKVYCAV